MSDNPDRDPKRWTITVLHFVNNEQHCGPHGSPVDYASIADAGTSFAIQMAQSGMAPLPAGDLFDADDRICVMVAMSPLDGLRFMNGDGKGLPPNGFLGIIHRNEMSFENVEEILHAKLADDLDKASVNSVIDELEKQFQ